jgi:PAS domain S-box-containing protein
MHEQRPDSRRIERPDASLTMENLVRTRALDAIKSGDIESAQALVEADHGRTLTLGQVFRLYQSELETQAVQLRESQLRTENTLDWFANLFRSLPVAAILVDAQGMVLDANDHALEELGMRRALRSLPVPLRRLMATADGEMRLSAMMARAAAGGTEAMDDAAMRTLDGVARWADLRLTRLPDAGGQPGAGAQAQQPSARFLCVFNDRTARVEAQRAREKALAAEHQRDLALSASQAKTQLLSRVSHELRTPLNAVLGFSQLLLTRPDSMDEASRVQVGHIRRAGEHLLSLVDEVLQINLAESGFLSLALHPVALDAVAQEVLALQQPSAAPLALSLRLDTTTGAEPSVQALGDARRVREVLVNLVSNAIKYNVPGGWVRVRVGSDAERAWVEVSDGGIGMNPEQLEHLFEPFNRLGAERLSVQGHGLGMSIARALVQAMGGTLTVLSQQGSGTRCTVSMPRAAAGAIEA